MALCTQVYDSRLAGRRFRRSPKIRRTRREQLEFRGGDIACNHLICSSSGLARDCHDLFLRGHRAGGVYKIQPLGSVPFDALCQMTSGESRELKATRTHRKKETLFVAQNYTLSHRESRSELIFYMTYIILKKFKLFFHFHNVDTLKVTRLFSSTFSPSTQKAGGR